MMSTVRALGSFVQILAVGVAVALLSLTVTRAAGPAGAESSAPLVAQGKRLFAIDFTPERGLGPLFNGTSCLTCHNTPSAGGMGGNGLATVLRVGRLHHTGFDPLMGQGGPIVRAHSVAELGQPCGLALGIPAGVNMTSIRNTPPLFGSGLIDALPDDVILAGAVPRSHGVHGHPHLIRDAQGRQRVGRFGWKADTATLLQFVADAFRNELGLTNPWASTDLIPVAHSQTQRCAGEADTPFESCRAASATPCSPSSGRCKDPDLSQCKGERHESPNAHTLSSTPCAPMADATCPRDSVRNADRARGLGTPVP
jgi:hypothetical protein